MHKQIGWDIGGAHLKAVMLSSDGQVEDARQLPCPLWLGLDHLETAIVNMLENFGIKRNQCRHAVTMTGELVDLFSDRHDGVVQISALVVKLLGNNTWFYCIGNAWLTLADVYKHSKLVASANWHASATLVANYIPNAILIDIGSTTTDIIAIEEKKIDCGLTDAERMQQDTLLYTGIVRTPLMAVAQKIMLDDQETNVAAEYFATTADVYRLTEELLPSTDMADTADGEEKTPLASAKRLARMVGHDVEDKPMASWIRLAKAFREKQVALIQGAAMKKMKDDMNIVGVGAGKFIVKEIAQVLDRPYVEIPGLLRHRDEHDLSLCLPAYAVAKLAFKGDQ